MYKKNSIKLNQNFAQLTHHINSQIIYHLNTTPSIIFLDLELFIANFDIKLTFISPANIELWIA